MNQIQQILKDRYVNVHPLVFHRSKGYAKSNGDLFDILDTIPETYPLVWDSSQRRWTTTDLLQSERFRQINNEKGDANEQFIEE